MSLAYARASSEASLIPCARVQLDMLRLWGVFDTEKKGFISVNVFDLAMPLLTEVIHPTQARSVT